VLYGDASKRQLAVPVAVRIADADHVALTVLVSNDANSMLVSAVETQVAMKRLPHVTTRGRTPACESVATLRIVQVVTS
jgi:hypothetical protein